MQSAKHLAGMFLKQMFYTLNNINMLYRIISHRFAGVPILFSTPQPLNHFCFKIDLTGIIPEFCFLKQPKKK